MRALSSPLVAAFLLGTALAQAPDSRATRGPAPTVDELFAALESGDANAREAAFAALVPLAKQNEAALGKRLSHKEPRVRLAALRIFQHAVIKAPAEQLLSLTRDENEDVRETAVIYMAACRPAGWTGALLKVASGDKSQSVRRQAIVGLGDSKDLAVVPDLVGLLGFVPDDYLAKKVASALLSLTGENKGVDPVAWERWWAEKGAERLRAQEVARAERAMLEARSALPR